MSVDSLSDVGSQTGAATLRPTIRGRRHVVAAGHYLAAQTAFRVLEGGGNAIDAGVAAGLTLGVVQSELVNIAGVAPIMIRSAATGETLTIAGLGGWPRGLDPQLFQRDHGGPIPEGLLRTVVPAAPDAWIKALRLHGTISFAEAAADAIRFGRDGFVMYPLMAELIAAYREGYARWPSSAAIYLPAGAAPKPGDLFTQEDLARTLQFMVDSERAAAGGREAGLEAARDAFYRGDIARRITAYHAENGGLLTMADLAEYDSPVEAAVTVRTGSAEVFTCGAWCQGPALLQLLRLLDRFDLAAMGHNSPAYVHTLVEAIKLVFADRHRFFGDPQFVDVPLGRLLSEAYAERRAAQLRPDRAWPGLPPAGDGAEASSAVGAAHRPCLDTSYVAVIDEAGNVFSATPSDVSYDTPVIPGTGLCVSSRGSQSWADPTHPSGVWPGKRPRLTPAPAMAIWDDGGVLAIGTPGGDVQLQAILQVWLALTVFGLEPQAAVEAPRFASYSFPDSFEPHAAFPGRLNLEGRFSGETVATLARLGHQTESWPDFVWRAGAVCLAGRDASGGLFAAADPRRPAYALGW
ncbi:MAG TPA: gamma-glutamyltransferase [Caulobacteraceae bacterium]|nr:gamma-glutamyltransferase [Caulobacteraceae bacterium]